MKSNKSSTAILNMVSYDEYKGRCQPGVVVHAWNPRDLGGVEVSLNNLTETLSQNKKYKSAGDAVQS